MTALSDAAKQSALDKAEVELERANADLKQLEAHFTVRIKDAKAKLEEAEKSKKIAYDDAARRDSDVEEMHRLLDMPRRQAREVMYDAEEKLYRAKEQSELKIKQAKARLSEAIKAFENAKK